MKKFLKSRWFFPGLAVLILLAAGGGVMCHYAIRSLVIIKNATDQPLSKVDVELRTTAGAPHVVRHFESIPAGRDARVSHTMKDVELRVQFFLDGTLHTHRVDYIDFWVRDRWVIVVHEGGRIRSIRGVSAAD